MSIQRVSGGEFAPPTSQYAPPKRSAQSAGASVIYPQTGSTMRPTAAQNAAYNAHGAAAQNAARNLHDKGCPGRWRVRCRWATTRPGLLSGVKARRPDPHQKLRWHVAVGRRLHGRILATS